VDALLTPGRAKHAGFAPQELKRFVLKHKESLANDCRGWISHRDMVAYYQTQEVTQLMRNAPAQSNTRTVVPQQKDLYPLRKMQADTISLKGMPSGGFTGVVNIVDLFSQFSWQVPVQTVGRASSAAAAVNAAIKLVAFLQQLLVLDADRAALAEVLLLRGGRVLLDHLLDLLGRQRLHQLPA
jgi:L-alanine-DL-glutamate epimerase-like enolase superfamily enzyme